AGVGVAVGDDPDQPLLASPGIRRLLRRAPSSPLPSPGATGMLDADATRWLAVRAPLHEAPWSIVLALDDREAFASVQGLKLRLLLTGLVLGTAAVVFSMLVLGRLVKPLEVLTAAARGVPRLDFSRAVPQRAPGEIGDLSRTFEAMRNALRSTLQGLRDSEERYRRSIDSANDAIFAVDPAAFNILSANRKAGELTRCAPGDLLGRCFLDLHPEEHRQRGREFVHRVAASGEGILREIDLGGSGGRRPGTGAPRGIGHGSGRVLPPLRPAPSRRQRGE